MSSVADVLSAAADLIEPEGAWTQGQAARDRHGNGVDYRSPDAVCFCALGACVRSVSPGYDDFAVRCFLRSMTPDGTIANWNDAPGRTQAEVVAKLREASALAREQSL